MSLFRFASTVSAFTLLSRITGLARELLIASSFGASALTDAFNVAFRIPNLLRRLFAEGAFSQAFTPVLAATQVKEGNSATSELISSVATLLFWVLLITGIFGVIAAPFLVWLLASGLVGQGVEASIAMTRMMFPYIIFMSLCALLSSVLNIYQRFAVPAATPVLLNISMIGGAWLGAPWFKTIGIEPIYALAASVMLGGVLQMGVQLIAVKRIAALQPSPKIAWRWSGIKRAWQNPSSQKTLSLMLPALLGVSVAQISLIINTQIASHMVSGSVSWLGYADRLMEFPVALLGVALGVVLMPTLAAAKAQHEPSRYSDLIDWALRLVVVLGLPCSVALAVFSMPLVSTLYHYGAFTPSDVAQTKIALTCYGVGLLGLLAIKVLAPGYYANQNIKTPVKIALGVLILTQVLNFFLVPHFAHAGLVLSIGLGALINALFLLIGLIRSKAYQPKKSWFLLLAKVLVACCILASGLDYLSHALPWLDWPMRPLGIWFRLGALLLIVLGSGVLYLCLLTLLGIKPRVLLMAPSQTRRAPSDA